MNKLGGKLLIYFVLMMICFIVSWIFFMKSGLIDLQHDNINKQVVIELEEANNNFNKMLGIPIVDYNVCSEDGCVDSELEKPKI